MSVWVRGHLERLAIAWDREVGIGDTLVLEVDVISVADRAVTLRYQGHTLSIDRQFVEL